MVVCGQFHSCFMSEFDDSKKNLVGPETSGKKRIKVPISILGILSVKDETGLSPHMRPRPGHNGKF